MSNTLITVIIPCYNAEQYIGATITSVMNQTYKDIEIIVIDDGSTDTSKEKINSFNDKRIKYHYQINKGLSAARNKGMSIALGGYFSFIDSDDICNTISNIISSRASVLFASKKTLKAV